MSHFCSPVVKVPTSEVFLSFFGESNNWGPAASTWAKRHQTGVVKQWNIYQVIHMEKSWWPRLWHAATTSTQRRLVLKKTLLLSLLSSSVSGCLSSFFPTMHLGTSSSTCQSSSPHRFLHWEEKEPALIQFDGVTDNVCVCACVCEWVSILTLIGWRRSSNTWCPRCACTGSGWGSSWVGLTRIHKEPRDWTHTRLTSALLSFRSRHFSANALFKGTFQRNGPPGDAVGFMLT